MITEKFHIIILTLLVHTFFANGQVTEEWVRRYSGPVNGQDFAVSVGFDNSGNVYVTGAIETSSLVRDYATIKYNSAGVQQWVQTYNGPGNADDEANSIAVDGSGNVYVTGGSIGFGTGLDYATIKYNSAGVQQWVRWYNGPPGNLRDIAIQIAVDGSGNVYVTGASTGSGNNLDYATIKYNSAGVQQWVQRYNGTGNADDEVTSMAVDGSGNVYVTGGSMGFGTSSDYATIKYNSAGVQQWVRLYNGPPGNDFDLPHSIAVDNSGNVYVTGGSIGSGINYDYATIKYNSQGVQQWVQRYNGPGNAIDIASSLAIDGSDNIYVTGGSGGLGTGSDYATIKYNSQGVQQWFKAYNGPGNAGDIPNSIAVDGSGNVYVTGESTGLGTALDYGTIKYNSEGVQQWFKAYNGPGSASDIAYSIAVDGSGNVYVTGGSVGSGVNYDYATIKYSQQIGIQIISAEVPESFLLFQNYPNPFNPNARIKFQIAKISDVKLTVFDVLGRDIQNLVNQRLSPGTYQVDFDASNYPSSVFFYSLFAGDFKQTKRMVFLK